MDLHPGVQYLWDSEAEHLSKGALTDANDNGQLAPNELDMCCSRTTFLRP